MRKFTLLTSVLLTAPFSMSNVSAQCVATQDCATLGYTETSCENGGIKCPFGNAWACKSDGTTDCTYRTIYFSDGSCGEQLIKGKTAIGVVVYDENNEKWIMALDNAASNVKWSTEYVDVPEITNYIVEIAAVSDLKSCENTEADARFRRIEISSGGGSQELCTSGSGKYQREMVFAISGYLEYGKLSSSGNRRGDFTGKWNIFVRC